MNRETLRYYERRGLLAEPGRSPGGHRLYPAEAVTELRVIKAAQRLGFTLDEVADLLELGRHRHGSRSDAGLQAQPTVKLAQIEDRIADLLELGRHRHGSRSDAGLQAQATVKLAQIEDRIADLHTIRDNLRTALDAGCDDLTICANTESCPLPFVQITTRPPQTGTPSGPT